MKKCLFQVRQFNVRKSYDNYGAVHEVGICHAFGGRGPGTATLYDRGRDVTVSTIWSALNVIIAGNEKER